MVDKVPFDKYELEPSPLTQFILERKSPHTCWQVTLIDSYLCVSYACIATAVADC